MDWSIRDYRIIIRSEFEVRRSRNPRYSLRAYARDLGLSSGRLTDILKGKTGLSRESAQRVSYALGHTPHEIDFFATLVELRHGRGKLLREIARAKLKRFVPPDWKQLQLDAFEAIAGWYHYAILELVAVKGFRSDADWIAARLGLTRLQVEMAIARMERLRLLEWRAGRLHPVDSHTCTPTDIPSEALRSFHRQILAKADAAISKQSVDQRDISSVVMAFDSSRLNEAKEKLRRFRRKFNYDMENSKQKDSVYCLSIQLFQLDQPQERPSSHDQGSH